MFHQFASKDSNPPSPSATTTGTTTSAATSNGNSPFRTRGDDSEYSPIKSTPNPSTLLFPPNGSRASSTLSNRTAQSLFGSPTPPVLHFAKSPRPPIRRSTPSPVFEELEPGLPISSPPLLPSFKSITIVQQEQQPRQADAAVQDAGVLSGALCDEKFEFHTKYFGEAPKLKTVDNLAPQATEDDAEEEQVFLSGEMSILVDEEEDEEEEEQGGGGDFETPAANDEGDEERSPNFAVRSLRFEDEGESQRRIWLGFALALLLALLAVAMNAMCTTMQDVKEFVAWVLLLTALAYAWWGGL